ncbi:hypothetical protein FVB9288_03197 [Flavobacterium sp. CECT 9288]|nr:hypothetical protein FVB9288_03197 [Flavobacterium sp. CECT 9288]
MNWQSIFNPFSRYSEKQLFVVGFVFLIVNCFVCFFTKTQMDSIFHFSENKNLTIEFAFIFVGISILSAILFLFLFALILNKKTRFIDIVNTVLISQMLNCIVLLCIKFSGMDALAKNLKTNSGIGGTVDLIQFTFSVLIVLGISMYGFVLIYNGFKTATNFKKWYHIILFVVLLFIFILFHQVYIQNLLVI